MNNVLRTIVVGIRSSDDAYHRKILAVSTGNGVQNAEATDVEGNHTGSHTFVSGVAISTIASVELVAAPYEVKLRFTYQIIEKGKVEVSRDGENILHTNFNQTPRKVVAKGASDNLAACVVHAASGFHGRRKSKRGFKE